MSEVFDVLVDQPFFAGMTDEQVRTVAEAATLVSFDEGGVIFVEGGPARYSYLILEGDVALTLRTQEHGSKIIQTLHRGDFVGWSWMYPPYRWSFDANLQTDVKAVQFDGPKLKKIALADPELGYAMMRRFTEVIVTRMQALRIQLLDVYSTFR
jgi:CRP/FNR family transcriptional regulator, cyclic AMP receptor protein